MNESGDRRDSRRQRRAHHVMAIAVLLMMVSGAAQIGSGIIDGGQGWSAGFAIMVLGPGLYLLTTEGAVVQHGGPGLRIFQMLRRSRGSVIALAILAAAASLYEGIRGALPGWLAGTNVVACCCMAMALRQRSPTVSPSNQDQ